MSHFVACTHGNVYYELHGPADGPLVIMIHGFASSSLVWMHNIKPLTDAGLRCLLVDLYGRGQTAKPNVTYDSALFMGQILDVVKGLELPETFQIVGSSMGGAIALSLSAQYPEKVDGLCLLAPAGIKQKATPAAKLAKIPGIGKLALQLFGKQLIRIGTKRNFVQPNAPALKPYYEMFDRQLKDPGFLPALHATSQDMPLFDMEDKFIKTAEHNIPTLVIWGTKDKILPHDNTKRLQQLFPNAQLITLMNAGHLPQLEEPERITPLILEHLRQVLP
ncbi:MAG: hypothetical protein CL920_22580 [Deltaproteobacteria bacterium]|nr:hypothetical protein [Deltaproteobacteria bacterium]|tara:strand:- start:9573 stop:10403 length:831 start_codon:yes stop_codon:yes gene_type:complete